MAEPAIVTTGAAVTRTRLPVGVAFGLALAALGTVALGINPADQIRDNLGRPLALADGKPLKGVV